MIYAHAFSGHFLSQENLLGSVGSVTEELAMVRLSIAEENSDREKIVRELEKELRDVKGERLTL